MNIIIIEDELPAREKIARLAREYDASVRIVGEAGSVREAVRLLPAVQADIILMDIQLSDGAAFEIFEQCRVDAPVIFTTAYDEYLTYAFSHNGIDYLLKPIQREKLYQAFAKYARLKEHFAQETPQAPSDARPNIQSNVQSVQNLLQQLGFVGAVPAAAHYKERIVLQKGREYVSMNVSDIAYFFTEHRIVSVFTHVGERYFTDKHLSDVEAELDPTIFFRLNRNYVAHIRAIQKFRPEAKGKIVIDLAPKPDEVVIVSQERAAAFRSWMER